ncbi:hypothetical protein GN956_G25339 [Arapaima gigas]
MVMGRDHCGRHTGAEICTWQKPAHGSEQNPAVSTLTHWAREAEGGSAAGEGRWVPALPHHQLITFDGLWVTGDAPAGSQSDVLLDRSRISVPTACRLHPPATHVCGLHIVTQADKDRHKPPIVRF